MDIVFDEIESSINYKYNVHMLFEMELDAAYSGKLLKELRNCKPKLSRKVACTAMQKYKSILR